MPNTTLLKFRIRLLVAAGASFAPGMFIPEVLGSQGTTTSGGSEGTGTETDTDELEYDDDLECGGGGCYGRPYVSEHVARTARAVESSEWAGSPRAPELTKLSASERRALADLWTRAGLSEHSSIAGFHRFALDLLAHGAPAKLVARAQRAAMQELEHAQACFGLASAYAGREIGPGPLPVGTSAPVARSLTELAVWTVHEGCVGETMAAWMASEIHRRAEDAAVVETMQKIAEEETEHAELSWAVVQWAISTGGAAVISGVRAAFSEARVGRTRHAIIHNAAHGLLSSAEVGRVQRVAFSRIVQPCARQLWAAA